MLFRFLSCIPGFCIRSCRGGHDRKTGGAEKMDWVGAIFVGGSLLAILLGLGAMEEGGWRSPLAATLVAIGALLGLLGIMWARSAKFPLIDVALLRLPAVNRVAIVQLLSGFGTFEIGSASRRERVCQSV